jgi:hypothetical protein
MTREEKKEYNKRHKRKIRSEARANGICITCCKNPMVSGRVHCKECIDYRNTRKLEAMSKGLCTVCWKRPAVNGLLRCQICVDNKKYYNDIDIVNILDDKKRRRAKAKLNNICTNCYKNPAVSGKTKCEKCLNNKKKRRIEFKKDPNRCNKCGNQYDPEMDEGYLTCWKCRTRPGYMYSHPYDRQRRAAIMRAQKRIYERKKENAANTKKEYSI